jgi:hypothetical protein
MLIFVHDMAKIFFFFTELGTLVMKMTVYDLLSCTVFYSLIFILFKVYELTYHLLCSLKCRCYVIEIKHGITVETLQFHIVVEK